VRFSPKPTLSADNFVPSEKRLSPLESALSNLYQNKGL
jgi:hypothetical protein